jgi:hypothetical protein
MAACLCKNLPKFGRNRPEPAQITQILQIPLIAQYSQSTIPSIDWFA